jgi:hypothetical protein
VLCSYDTRAQRHEGTVPTGISFEENEGQAPPSTRFLSRGRGYTIFLKSTGYDVQLRGVRLHTTLAGESTAPTVRGENVQPGRVHYLKANSSVKSVPTYGQIRYERVYPGIDLLYYGNQHQLEYDFLVSPGADAGRIILRFEGPDSVHIDDGGNLVLHTKDAVIVQHKPRIYQRIGKSTREVDGKYRMISANAVGFQVGAYDRTSPLVIDPILSYATFLGGSNGDDAASGVATDAAGNVYITGSTTSTNFPTLSPLQANAGSQDADNPSNDAFVTKLSPAGALIYSTYIGGSNDDNSNAIAVDSSGNVTIAGSTTSSDFPTTAGAVSRACNIKSSGTCLDGFVARLNPAGSGFVYSTYLGGTNDDEARGVALDASGNAYVLGKTASTDFPVTAGAYSTDSSTAAFVTKLGPSGAIVYSTYFGAGSGATDPRGIAADPSGNTYITGATPSSTSTGTDVFITKLNAGGSGAVYTQFLRGSKDDAGNAITLDSSGNAYVAGQTSSVDFPTTSGVFQNGFAGGALFRSTDSALTWTAASSGIRLGSVDAFATAARGPGAAGPVPLYAGGDDEISGGLFTSADGGTTWASSSAGIPDPRIHALVTDPRPGGAVYAGTRTGGVYKSLNGATWAATSLNNVFVTALAVDPMAPATVYAGTDAHGIHKSTDGAATWVPINTGLPSSSVRSIVVDPVTPAIYAATGVGIYKSVDGGLHWNSANGGLLDPNVNAIAIDAHNPNVLYAATNSVGVFRSLNGGTFWLAASGGLPSSGAGTQVSALMVDAVTGTLYASIAQGNFGRTYRSSNGINWTAVGPSTARVTLLRADSSDSGTAVYAATAGDSDAFVAKWNPSGALVYLTYLGGYSDDQANAITVDAAANVYVAGNSGSLNFPVANAIQAAFGGGSDVVTDAFVAKLNASGSSILYATYLGGSNSDTATGVAVDSSGNVYVVGSTGSRDFPATPAAFLAFQPGLTDAFVAKISEGNTFGYSISPRGGTSTTSQGGGAVISAGYGAIRPASGSTTPSGLAIFGYRENNVLVSEAAVPASPAISSGRIYAEVAGPVNTGLAIANPGSAPATLTFYFTDQNGQTTGSGSTAIAANSQTASFLNEAPYNAGKSFSGTFTFTASSPVAVIALRGFTNERSEFLITTLPVADLSVPASTGPILFPHFADGAGWTTQMLLVNPSDAPMSGSIQFASSAAQNYSIPGKSSVNVATAGIGTTVVTGSVRVVPAAGSNAPSGIGVFSFKNGGITVMQTGVPALPVSNAVRLYAEQSGTPGQIGSIQTGIAVANPAATPASVLFEVNTLNGASTNLTGTITVPANGQAAMFLNQIPGLDTLFNPFKGVLRVSTTAPGGISVVGLRGRYNERGDFLIATTQPTIEADPPSTSTLFFPHFADGGGFTTQFILFNGTTDQSSSGSLQFYTQSGQPLSLTVR